MGNGQLEIWDKYIKVYIYGLEKNTALQKLGIFLWKWSVV